METNPLHMWGKDSTVSSSLIFIYILTTVNKVAVNIQAHVFVESIDYFGYYCHLINIDF